MTEEQFTKIILFIKQTIESDESLPKQIAYDFSAISTPVYKTSPPGVDSPLGVNIMFKMNRKLRVIDRGDGVIETI